MLVSAVLALAALTFSDYRQQQPGTVHKITIKDLPAPFATKSVDNGPRLIARPAKAWPKAPAGFQVSLYADGLNNPRLIRMAPNGDLFLAESRPGQVRVLRGVGADGRAAATEVFAGDLRQPFGIAFYPPGPEPRYVYVANTDSVVRFPYRAGDLKARGPAEVVVPNLPAGGRLRGGGHWTRDIVFSLDGRKLFIAVGSHSNVNDTDKNPVEHHRANLLECDPNGKGLRVYAWGIRNPVGIAVDPKTGVLWASVNERDGLGDNLVPDYITHVQEGGFYGWPWYYMGGHQDPRHKGKHPELASKVITPDVLLQPHNASLQMEFYRGGIVAAQHGSWNKSVRTGYEVIFVPMRNGRATGEYQDFLTGFTTEDGEVWGRPVGVTPGKSGELYVSDDGSESVWRVIPPK